MKQFEFQKECLDAIHEHARAEYPDECCGWVIRRSDGRQEYRPSKNLQNKYHKFDPENYPRTAREAFLPEMNRLQADLDSLEASEALFSIVHSHIDCGAYFSEEDKIQMGSPDGEGEIYKTENYLVVGMREGEVEEHAVFYYDAAQKDFAEAEFNGA